MGVSTGLFVRVDEGVDGSEEVLAAPVSWVCLLLMERLIYKAQAKEKGPGVDQSTRIRVVEESTKGGRAAVVLLEVFGLCGRR